MALERTGLVLIAVAVLSSGFLAGAASAADATETRRSIEGRIQTPGVLDLAGSTEDVDDADLVHLQAPDEQRASVVVSAETLALQYAWAKGHRVDPGDPFSRNRVLTDVGNATETYTSVELGVSDLGSALQMLAVADQTAAAVDGRANGTTTAHVVDPGPYVSVGHSDEARSGRGSTPRVGFTHDLHEATPAVSGLDDATVDGNFTLFIHNATIEGTTASGSLHHWTGHRSNQTAPGTTEFHQRVTVLRISNGTLSIETDSAVEALGPQLSAEVNGTVASEDGARGQLLSPTTAYLYESTQIQLDGHGVLELSSSNPAGAEAVGSQLAATVQGQFDVAATPGVLETTRTDASDDSTPWGWSGAGLLLGLVCLGSAILVYERRDEDPSGAAPRPVMAGLAPVGADSESQESFQERLSQAREAFEAQDFQRAARQAERLTRRDSRHPAPWDLLGRSLLEMGETGAARETYERYDEAMDDDEPDALMGLARANRAAGDVEGAALALVRLSRVSPRQAAVLLGRPRFTEAGVVALEDLHVDAIEAWVRDLLDGGRWDAVRELGRALARARPGALLRLAESEIAGEICRHGIGELGAPILRPLVEIAWQNDHLELASDAFLALARTDPEAAAEIVRTPGYGPLADDVRVQELLPVEREESSQGVPR